MSDQDPLVLLIEGIEDNLGRRKPQPMPVTAARQILPLSTEHEVGRANTLPKADPKFPDRSSTGYWTSRSDRDDEQEGLGSSCCGGTETVKAEWALICTAHNLSRAA
ncbi:MAG: hypothetical protein EOS26_11665 [Mesorhizobium sp.]|uniref:hypothetical protein n=1 Tax=Mesorhizobium sp. TaxID=1871066 RepID=UPI000FE92BE8|nr:hypothetical protein [Mesorhizobium sp.]RWB36192.1 MAG: hypothetical protein EOQ41_00955 [Mesorhizobium sp.]RWF76654.1 MAG: hypothetical protein EOS26_11665 [Mesorhizobium sp.]TIX84249.1 MAG: hypothetical protein E5V21_05325 [Mesorhizobium sp.]